MPSRSRLSRFELHPGQQPRPGRIEAEADVVQLDDLVPQPGRAQVQVGDAHPGRGLAPALDHGGGRLDAGLGLAAAGRRAPPQPGQLLAGQVAAGGLGRVGLGLAGGLGFEVGGVAAVVHVAPAPVQLQDPGGDPIQQVAVVGDQHQPAPVLGQPVLQPVDAVDVEVVGGLVEHQQVAGLPPGPGPAPPAWPGRPTGWPRRRRAGPPGRCGRARRRPPTDRRPPRRPGTGWSARPPRREPGPIPARGAGRARPPEPPGPAEPHPIRARPGR